MAPPTELVGEVAKALGSPSELGLGVPTGDRVDQRFEITAEGGVFGGGGLSARTWATDPTRIEGAAGLSQLAKTTGDGSPRDAGGAMDLCDASPAQVSGFRGQDEAPLSFVQPGQYGSQFLPKRGGGHEGYADLSVLNP